MTAARGRPKPGDSLFRVTSPRRNWLFFGPSRSTIIGGRWYRFKRGHGLAVMDADVARRAGYLIEYIRPATADDIEYLESNIGSEWSWLHNCATVMSRPLDDRWEIAWRVSVIVFAALTVFFAVAAYLNGGLQAIIGLCSS